MFILVSELFDIVDETATALFAAGRLPEQASRIDEVSKEDGSRYVTKESKDHKLHSQRKGALLLGHRSQYDHEQRHLCGGHHEGHEEQQYEERKDGAARCGTWTSGGHRHHRHLGEVLVGTERLSLASSSATINAARDVGVNT